MRDMVTIVGCVLIFGVGVPMLHECLELYDVFTGRDGPEAEASARELAEEDGGVGWMVAGVLAGTCLRPWLWWRHTAARIRRQIG